MPRFEVRFNGGFFSYPLYDSRGREVFDLIAACELAESMYDSDWKEVCNGQEGTDRDSWLEDKSLDEMRRAGL